MVGIRVLGSVDCVGDEGVVWLGAPKQRRLLAALAAHAGEERSVDALMEAIWGSEPPPSALKLLRIYISQLRKALPPPAQIITGGSSYVLDLGGGTVDADVFENLLAQARGASRAGNAALSAVLLKRAMRLWRGAAYAEFAYEDFARGDAERLEELRLAAQEELIDAQLSLGEHRGVLPDALALVREHPTRERPHQLTMLSLYRCGRHSEALELYTTLRRRLDEELGLEPGVELRDLQGRILDHDPSLAAPRDAPPPQRPLPSPTDRLLGRERELAELRQLLGRDDVRLLVLTGAGGTGKTCLALQAAREAAPAFANGAVFVSLALLDDATLVPGAILDALGVTRWPGQDPVETLLAASQSQELLLVVDNVEHVRAGAPVLVDLLTRAPRLTVLATSRVVLHLSGERVYPVDPLAIDVAAELFRARATAADPALAFAGEEETITSICRRLDGLPLAVELAAVRARTISPGELLARLDQRLPLLAGGPRDLPARQQTLRATLEWSHDLLAPSERQLLRRLSVFAAPVALGAIETVCETTVEVLGGLVDHSFVNRSVTPSGSRYEMLQTVREFAQEHLLTSNDHDDVRARHAEYFLAAAGAAPEPEEIQAALQWSLRNRRPLAPHLAVASGRYWHAQGQLGEGRVWLEASIALADSEPALQAELLGLLGALLHDSGDLAAAASAVANALELVHGIGDEPLSGWLRVLLADVRCALGDVSLRDALAESERASSTLERANDRARLADTLVITGKLRLWLGSSPADTEALERARTLARESGNRAAELLAIEWLANTFVDLRTPTDEAIQQQLELLQCARGAPRAEAGVLMPLSWLYGYAGQFDEARSTLARSREMFGNFGATVEWAAGALNAGAIELLADDPVAAERALREADHRLATHGERGYRASLAATLAESLYAQGRYDDAHVSADTARRLAIRDDIEVQVRWRAVEARIRARHGDAAAGQRLLDDALKHTLGQRPLRRRNQDGTRTPIPQPGAAPRTLIGTLFLAQGDVFSLDRRHADASEAYRRARDLFCEKKAWPLTRRAETLLGAAMSASAL